MNSPSSKPTAFPPAIEEELRGGNESLRSERSSVIIATFPSNNAMGQQHQHQHPSSSSPSSNYPPHITAGPLTSSERGGGGGPFGSNARIPSVILTSTAANSLHQQQHNNSSNINRFGSMATIMSSHHSVGGAASSDRFVRADTFIKSLRGGGAPEDAAASLHQHNNANDTNDDGDVEMQVTRSNHQSPRSAVLMPIIASQQTERKRDVTYLPDTAPTTTACCCFGGGDEGSDEQSSQNRRDENDGNIFSRFRKKTIPLQCVLLFQSVLVIAAFVAIIASTSVMVDDSTRKLLEEGVTANLQYARSRILAPIHAYEKKAMSMRERMLMYEVTEGHEMCSGVGSSVNLSSSVDFFAEGVSTIDTNPLLSFLFYMRWSTERIRPDNGLPDLVECDAAPDYILIVQNGTNRVTERAVHRDDLVDLDGLVPHHAEDYDYFFEDYVTKGFSFTDMGWDLDVLYDPTTDGTDLLLTVMLPLKINRTNAATHLVETYIPDLSAPQTLKKDPSLKTIATVGIDVSMTAFIPLMTTVTPSTDGSHTTLYDLDHQTMVCTSMANTPLFDADNNMWPAGKTSSEPLNDAFGRANVWEGRQRNEADGSAVVESFETEAAAGVVFSTLEDDPGAPVTIKYQDGHVISWISIRTKSGIDFVLVQSTPEGYYFGYRVVMIVVGVVVALAIVAVCLAIGYAVLVPLKAMEANMQLAAVMKNDRVVSTRSILSEVQQLCTTFDKMNAKLLQAREFMPQALLCEDSEELTGLDDDDDDENDDDEGEASTSFHTSSINNNNNNYTGGMKMIGDGGGSSAIDGSRSTMTSGVYNNNNAGGKGIHSASASTATSGMSNDHQRNANNNLGAAAKKGFLSAVHAAMGGANNSGIVAKRVTILVVNQRSFHDHVSLAAPSSAVVPTSVIASLINTICGHERGVVDSFHGDHFVLSFNAVKTNAQGPTKAVKAALAIIAAGRDPELLWRTYGGEGGAADGKRMTNQQQQQHLRIGATATTMGLSARNNNSNNNKKGLPTTTGASSVLPPQDEANAEDDENNQRINPITFSIGASTGRACVGNLGPAGLKRLSIIGKVYSRAAALERICRKVVNLAAASESSFGYNNDDEEGEESDRPSAPAIPQQPKRLLNHSSSRNYLLASQKKSSSISALSSSSAMLMRRGGPGVDEKVQCVVDSLMATEIAHGYTLQVLGGITGSAAFVDTRQDTKKQNNNNNNRALQNQNNNSAIRSTCDVLYAVRGNLSDAKGLSGNNNKNNMEDEWLYQIQDATSGGADALLAGVNTAMLGFLDEVSAMHAAASAAATAEERAVMMRKRKSSSHPHRKSDQTTTTVSRSATPAFIPLGDNKIKSAVQSSNMILGDGEVRKVEPDDPNTQHRLNKTTVVDVNNCSFSIPIMNGHLVTVPSSANIGGPNGGGNRVDQTVPTATNATTTIMTMPGALLESSPIGGGLSGGGDSPHIPVSSRPSGSGGLDLLEFSKIRHNNTTNNNSTTVFAAGTDFGSSFAAPVSSAAAVITANLMSNNMNGDHSTSTAQHYHRPSQSSSPTTPHGVIDSARLHLLSILDDLMQTEEERINAANTNNNPQQSTSPSTTTATDKKKQRKSKISATWGTVALQHAKAVALAGTPTTTTVANQQQQQHSTQQPLEQYKKIMAMVEKDVAVHTV